MRRFALGCFLLPLLLAGGACTVTGSSPSEMKHALQRSFLYVSADAFSTPGATDPFDTRERLSEPQKRQVVRMYQDIVDVLVATAQKHDGMLRAVFDGMQQSTLRPRVTMSDSGLSTPLIKPDGEILVDVRVARLMYRDAVLASMEDGGIGGANFMEGLARYCGSEPQTDGAKLQCFMTLKHRVDRMESQSVLGVLLDRRTRRLDDDSPFFLGADLTMRSMGLQARYTGVMMFMTAHEIGHVALGHLDRDRHGQLETPAQRIRAEHEADDYAVTLLALATPQLSILGSRSVATVATGYEGFLGQTYVNAQWSQGGDSHPPAQSRLARSRALHAQLREQQSDAFWSAVTQRLRERHE